MGFIRLGDFMSQIYLVVCFLIALMLPHLTDDSVSVLAQIILQAMFIVIGLAGFKTFNEQ